MLVDAVAKANRCSSVLCEAIGFTTVLGLPHDLEAVELLSTSLLVQASRAMLLDSRGPGAARSRTAPFRRAFLVSYALRIGERLVEVTDQATAATGRGQELVPLLREHAERVETARQGLFPEVTARSTTVSDDRGWVLGRAAADRAQLDIRAAVPAR